MVRLRWPLIAGAAILAGAGVVALVPMAGAPDGEAQCEAGGPTEVLVPGGSFVMGEKGIYPEEHPPRRVEVEPFWIDAHEVTNGQFAAFVEATGYVTLAERRPDPAEYPDIPADRLVPGAAVFVGGGAGSDPRMWWRFVPGADWRHPAGPGSSIEGREDYPVVQVAWEDARAYASWLGRQLPDEAQWEYAARGGEGGTTYAWGEEVAPGGKAQANHWQGVFPLHDTGEDGHPGLARVGCYPPNPYGLHDMIGNVWEWTASAWSADHATPVAEGSASLMVIKGGSYLCADNYCRRYRPPARQAGDAGMGSSHTGFRTIRSAG